MADAMKRFWDWANQPVAFGAKKSKEALEPMVVAETAEPVVQVPVLQEQIEPEHSPVAESSDPNDYLGHSADDVVDGVERYLENHALSGASEISWVQLVNEIKVIQLKRMQLTELENECVKIRSDLINCKKNLAMHVKRAAAEGSLSISMHEKRLDLARAVNQRIDSL